MSDVQYHCWIYSTWPLLAVVQMIGRGLHMFRLAKIDHIGMDRVVASEMHRLFNWTELYRLYSVYATFWLFSYISTTSDP